MTTPLETLIAHLEEITKHAYYEEVRKVLDEYYEAIETPGYDFEKRWGELSPATKAKFWKKVKQIESDAIQRISKEDNVSCEKIREVITPLDPEAE